MKEVWKDIQGYEGYYQVSNLGRVKSLDRFRKSWTKGYIQKGKILEYNLHGIDRYYRVNLCVDDKRKHHSVHRLVCDAFVPNPKNKCCVNHIDGDKLNNHCVNLEWVTYKENYRHARELGLIKIKSEDSEIATKVIGLYNEDKSIFEITKILNLDQKTIQKTLLNNNVTIKNPWFYTSKYTGKKRINSMPTSMHTLNGKHVRDFESMGRAIVWLKKNGLINVYSSTISEVCRGKRNDAYGYKWKRKEITK